MDSEATGRPTLVAVATRAGVSPSTASLAFSGAGPVSESTRARVLAAAEELGYAGPDPRAASLRRGRSGIVGVVFDDRLGRAFRDPMNRATLDGITDELGPAGSALLLLTDSGEGPASVTAAPVDAIVLIGCSPRVDESIAILRQRSVPVVAIEAEAMDGVLGVDIDNRVASRRLAEHLRSLGHEDVAIVSLPLDVARERVPLASPAVGSIHTSVERSAGVRDVYPNASGITATGSFVEEGELAGHALLADPDHRPTAVVAQSDLLAVGVIRAARELGIRVPEDLSVVGFDGVALDGIVSDDLTTMVQPAVEKGRAAARGALALIAGGDAEPVLFECTFHEGATTARVRAREI